MYVIYLTYKYRHNSTYITAKLLHINISIYSIKLHAKLIPVYLIFLQEIYIIKLIKSSTYHWFISIVQYTT